MGVPGRRGRVGPGAGERVAWRVPTGRDGFGVCSENGLDGGRMSGTGVHDDGGNGTKLCFSFPFYF